MDYIKKILPYALAIMAGVWVGFYIGTQYYPRVETKTVAVVLKNIVTRQPSIIKISIRDLRFF